MDTYTYPRIYIYEGKYEHRLQKSHNTQPYSDTHTDKHTDTHIYTLVHIHTRIYIYTHTRTGWRRLIGSPKLQIIFHKWATKYRALLLKMTYKDKGSYESWPPCIYPSIYFLSNTPILQKSKLISIYLSITHTCCNRCRPPTRILQHLFAIAVYFTHLFCKQKTLYLCITHTYFAIVKSDIYQSMYHTPLTHWDLSHTIITHTYFATPTFSRWVSMSHTPSLHKWKPMSIYHTHLCCKSGNVYLSVCRWVRYI